jgi:hypothetical protein
MPQEKPKKPKDGKREHREELLDEALKQSFPASDPPAIVSPHPAHDKTDQ